MPTPPPVDVVALLFTALLNPVVALVAVLMGLRADQWLKVFIAGFAAALIGSALIYVLVRIGLGPQRLVRAPGGLFIVQFALGTLWAAVAYLYARRMRPR